MNVIPRTRLAH